MSAASADPLVLVVDEDEAARRSLGVLLDTAGYAVEAVDSGRAAIARVRALARPVCVLLDMRLPDLDGLAVLHELLESGAPLRVVMVTGDGDIPTAVAAMKAGATDFIEKPCSRTRLLDVVAEAVGSLAAGGGSNPSPAEAAARFDRLSPRERDVAHRLVDGLTNKQIARELAISPRTVEVYRAGVMSKMEAANLSQLIKMGLALGLGAQR